ncbi:hypothetical protein HSTV1_30 [Haloarcula sinaiiensis tailed virus 1]|uniref:Uncharacterized protein n=1 Tax=Haloarcula sinaiiensis tailed virus 1 TaxID=1262530 RepID=R9QTN2_9CAUD|nr:hypothetical protein HSTV1_30 [Haloarcula sinaiiensis tailed virus 1]AGC34575.1 hypothetical protein HSTV1_30 [Haloarcula sinaiiensis tailed virus 1]
MQRNDYAKWTAVSRRQALLGIGTLAAGGGSLAVAMSEPGAAQVSVDSFSVSDSDMATEQADPVVDVSLGYSYDAGNNPVADLRFELLVGGDVVASDELTTDKTTFDGTTELSGRAVDASAWEQSDFAPDVASAVERDVTVAVRFAVLASDGSVIVEDSKSDTATVKISHPQEVRLVASVGGSGTIANGE